MVTANCGLIINGMREKSVISFGFLASALVYDQ
jgi:hypothetical protein